MLMLFIFSLVACAVCLVFGYPHIVVFAASATFAGCWISDEAIAHD